MNVLARAALAAGCAAAFLGAHAPAMSQAITHTQAADTQAQPAQQDWRALDARDKLIAQIWGLDEAEMQRAKVLLEGPRKAFSVENLSPVEALGIHARNDAERRKYAELFARALHADVERSLAWNSAFYEAMGRLYPNEPVVSSAGLPLVAAPVAAADALGVPRTQVIDATTGKPASDRGPALLGVSAR